MCVHDIFNQFLLKKGFMIGFQAFFAYLFIMGQRRLAWSIDQHKVRRAAHIPFEHTLFPVGCGGASLAAEHGVFAAVVRRRGKL